MQKSFLDSASKYASQIKKIEKAIQEKWQQEKVYTSNNGRTTGDYKYIVGMFPYPSGNAHLGHALVYSITDTIARLERFKGHHVLHPLGWDAFGLPAENAAVKNKVDPQVWTSHNIQKMRDEQIGPMGFSFDYDHELNTSDPEYYKWTQWLFLKMYEHGLVYRAHEWVNWDPVDQTVLANEQVIDGKGWRSGVPVERRQMEQWYVRITDFAEDLHNGLDTLTGWSESALSAQRSWIGRKEGIDISFSTEGGVSISAFTSAPENLTGASVIVLAPESTLLEKITTADRLTSVVEFKKKALLKKSIDRAGDKDNGGVFTGAYAIHPLTQKRIPIYVGDYVLDEYNNTAHICSPAHDEKDAAFCSRHGITPVTPDGLSAQDIVELLEKNNVGKKDIRYRLRDWAVGRQRFWGAPIPMLKDAYGQWFPVPEKELPVLLPQKCVPESLAKNASFKLVTTDDGRTFTRETDTFDTFMCSTWYLWRFLNPNKKDAAWDKNDAKKWMPVDVYVGGLEHANQHMIYLRFMSHFLHKIGLTPVKEPIRSFLDNGMVQSAGKKMSKSLGNVVRPDEMIEKYGADALHMYILSQGPYNRNFEWNEDGLSQKKAFLGRLYNFYTTAPLNKGKVMLDVTDVADDWSKDLLSQLKQCADGVDHDISSRYSFHTAIAKMHDFANTLLPAKTEATTPERVKVFSYAAQSYLKALGTVAPHLSDAIWRDVFEVNSSLFKENWPTVDNAFLLQKSLHEIPVMANGKKIGMVSVQDTANDNEVINAIAEAAEEGKLRQRFNQSAIAKSFVVRSSDTKKVRMVNLTFKAGA